MHKDHFVIKLYIFPVPFEIQMCVCMQKHTITSCSTSVAMLKWKISQDFLAHVFDEAFLQLQEERYLRALILPRGTVGAHRQIGKSDLKTCAGP